MTLIIILEGLSSHALSNLINVQLQFPVLQRF